MSIFGSIMSKIFSHPAASGPSPAAPPAATDSTTPAPPAPTSSQPSASAFDETAAPATPAQPAASAPTRTVDVGAILADMDAKSGQHLNYKTSIVDLMKLLGLDSSFENRKTLATELHYTGDTGDSAAMNVWLHKQVMDQLAQNGGNVPADLRG